MSPLALEPNATYPVVLSTDADKPKNKQPTFIFRYLSGRQWKELAKLSDEFDKKTTGEDTLSLVFKAIKMALIGWRNMIGPDGKEIKYKPDELDAIVTPNEAIELMQAAVAQQPTMQDKKKFVSPSGSSTGRSAKRAKA